MLGWLLHLLIFSLLTILTQVGGLLYILVIVLKSFFRWQGPLTLGLFLSLYLLSSFVLIPAIAPVFGRVSLPMRGDLEPANLFTCILNRHYVQADGLDQLMDLSKDFNQQYGVPINYLDANFPFINGFPLLPHLSHNDGQKIDLAFIYQNPESGQLVSSSSSWFGYGVFEEPVKGEVNYPELCEEKGYWQYSLLGVFVRDDDELSVAHLPTKSIIKALTINPSVDKIFIEPHLKERWDLDNEEKIRFHGCHAVRHDDHIHLQFK